MMQHDLFADQAPSLPSQQVLGPGALLLRGFAANQQQHLLETLFALTASAPFRHMQTPGGHTMSVGMSNCGPLGWVSDQKGYRYAPLDPLSGQAWPAMPEQFLALAAAAAEAAGFANFLPDACLINRYAPGTRLSLHQDRNERDLLAPIVSVSLGLPANFLFGGSQRQAPTLKIPLFSGDVVVWGGPSRLAFHGVATLRDGEHALTGKLRFNLTFRKVL
jgi:alkylated DNA repair protein (DNA oxidative demethylase)